MRTHIHGFVLSVQALWYEGLINSNALDKPKPKEIRLGSEEVFDETEDS